MHTIIHNPMSVPMDNTAALQQHPLELFSPTITAQGVAVINNVNSMPLMREAYVSPHLVIAVCHSGYVEGEYDEEPIAFQPRGIAVVYPNHSLVTHKVSDDYRATLIVVSSDFFKEHRQQDDHRYQLELQNSPDLRLNEEQYSCIVNLCHILDTVSNRVSSNRTALVAHTLSLLSNMIRSFRSDNGIEDHSSSSREMQIFKRFYDDLLLYYQQSHEVNYYAQRQCLSAKYFGTMVKDATGVGPIEWISRFLTQKAKNLLRSRRDLTIQNIAHLMGFNNQAVFSRFFKNQTGLSPTQYRSRETD